MLKCGIGVTCDLLLLLMLSACFVPKHNYSYYVWRVPTLKSKLKYKIYFVIHILILLTRGHKSQITCHLCNSSRPDKSLLFIVIKANSKPHCHQFELVFTTGLGILLEESFRTDGSIYG